MAWQKIDTAPKDGTEIILACWGNDGRDPIVWWLEESCWLLDGSVEGWSLTTERFNAHNGSYPATHWMALAPPNEQAADVADRPAVASAASHK